MKNFAANPNAAAEERGTGAACAAVVGDTMSSEVRVG